MTATTIRALGARSHSCRLMVGFCLLAAFSSRWHAANGICVEKGERPTPRYNLDCSPFPTLESYCCKTAEDAVNVSACVPRPWTNSACQGGYFHSSDGPAPCPDGFYCPENSLCLVRCTDGASCIQSPAVVESSCPAEDIALSAGKCCQPYYELSVRRDVTAPLNFTCGGAPNNQPCPKGHYCPTPMTKPVPCPSGHYCREGSVKPQRCPLLATCPSESSAPKANALGLVLDLIIVLVLLLVLWVYNNRLALRKYLEHYRQTGTDGGCVRLFHWPEQRQLRQSLRRHKQYLKLILSGLTEPTARNEDQTDLGRAEEGNWKSTMTEKDFQIRISFENLTVWHRQSHRKLVDDATGEIQAGKLTAIMGGSGSGKTTFLNALSGKAYYTNIEGRIKVNGQEENLANPLVRYRSVVAFAPQDDVMHSQLSVHEVLHYQAALRLGRGAHPGRCSVVHDSDDMKKKIAMRVAEVGHDLGLLAGNPNDPTSIWCSVIGSAEKRGVSGGERKRVNIGMELVADPTVLFLDEPTTGLDSVRSLKLIKFLKQLAEKTKMTIVMVVHQPRYDAFSQFDDVILLQKGGSIAFQGSPSEAEGYFAQLSDELDFAPSGDKTNPADYYLDVIASHNEQAVILSADPGRESLHAKQFAVLWRERQKQWTEHVRKQGRLEFEEAFEPSEFSPSVRSSAFIQFWIFLKRLAVLMVRGVRTLLLDQFLALLAGSVLGALFSEVELERVYTVNVMSGLAIGLTGMLAALRAFGSVDGRPVFWREAAAGINRLAYFLAVNVSHLPIIVITPLVYLSLFYTFTAPRTSFSDYYLIVLMTYWCTYGMGYLISTIFHPTNSKMAAVVVGLIASTLTGSNPTLCKLNTYTFIGPAAYSLSYTRWYGEAVFEKEALEYPLISYYHVQLLAGRNDYSLDNFSLCMGMLFVFGLLTRVAAFFCLIFTHRGNQK